MQGYNNHMDYTERITLNPPVMSGKPCIRGMRVTVGLVVGLIATGVSAVEILCAYPCLEAEDISVALVYRGRRLGTTE